MIIRAGLVLRAVYIRIKIYLPDFVFRLRLWIALRYRKMRYGYEFRKIPLTQGRYAIVDPERYEEIARYKWYSMFNGRNFYAIRIVKIRRNGRVIRKNLAMHRVIMGTEEGKVIDHINHNSLDNRLANLRAASFQQNTWNQRKQRGNCSSKYKGVIWAKENKKWRAQLTFKSRPVFIGYFDDEQEAAMAYDARAKELFGEYACLNFPNGSAGEKRKKGLFKRLRFFERMQLLANTFRSVYNDSEV